VVAAEDMVQGLLAGVRKSGRVLRLDVRIVHRDPAVREALVAACLLAGAREPSPYRQYRLTRVLELDDAEESLFARLPATTRRAVRRPEKAGLCAGEGISADDVPHLLGMLERAFERNAGKAPRGEAERDLRLAITVPSHRRVATLERTDRSGPERIVAFALGVDNGDHVVFSHGASARGEAFANLPLAYAPIWSLVQWAAQRGAHWFDLGGVTQSPDPSHPQAGIAEFKRRFGGTEMEVAREMRFALDPTGLAVERLVGRVLGR
jgi:hypothetical protein